MLPIRPLHLTLTRSVLLGMALGTILFGTCGTRARAGELAVQTLHLTNGLKVLVQEDFTVPTVAYYTFYRVGSRNERPGTTGLSHFFEHMMFNGAKRYGPREFDRVMEAAGGRNNAYTSQDVTVYQNWFPPSTLPLIFDLEADRMEHLNFDPAMIASERGVVASERRTSVEADNMGLLGEQLWAAAYTAHPYQWPVIGWMVDIEHWTLHDLQAHFRMGYAPSNALVVIAGAVRFAEVEQLARKFLNPIPAQPAPPEVTTAEPPQAGERRVELVKLAQLPALMIGYHVPASRHPDFYPLQVLEKLLFAGRSSRLHHRLVEVDQSALDVSGGLQLSLDPTLFSVNITVRQGTTPATVEKAIEAELERLAKGDVSEDELDTARNQALAEHYRGLKTADRKASALGNYELFLGGYRKLGETPGALRKVTKADLQRVVRAYFHARNRTVATLVPETPAQP